MDLKNVSTIELSTARQGYVQHDPERGSNSFAAHRDLEAVLGQALLILI